jgi:hypothetical protein
LPGLTRLGLSADTFHQEFIPIEKIRNAIIAGNKLGLDCAVRICHLDDPDAEIEGVRQELIEVEGLYEIEHQPVQPLGRAADEVDPDSIFSYDTTMTSCRSADSHAINTAGDVIACCGATAMWPGDHPLRFGNVHDRPLDEILKEADINPVLHAVRLWGPAGLVNLAKAQADEEGAPFIVPKINNICGLCEYMVADPHHAALLRRAVANPEALREIALARMVELGEVSLFMNLEEQDETETASLNSTQGESGQ